MHFQVVQERHLGLQWAAGEPRDQVRRVRHGSPRRQLLGLRELLGTELGGQRLLQGEVPLPEVTVMTQFCLAAESKE